MLARNMLGRSIQGTSLIRTSFKICSLITLLLGTSLVAIVPARAGTISIAYSFSGTGTVTGMSGNFLDLSGAATGSVEQWNRVVNAVWNPVTDHDVSQLNLSTGLDNGTFTMTFADGATLSGALFENQTMVNPMTLWCGFRDADWLHGVWDWNLIRSGVICARTGIDRADLWWPRIDNNSIPLDPGHWNHRRALQAIVPVASHSIDKRR